MEEDHSKKSRDSYFLKVGIQLTKRLKVLHDLGYVHNDIKLANILLSEDFETVFLIDFGISSTYVSSDGTHKSQEFHNRFHGNKMYSSSSACSGHSTSRRDDI